MRDVERVEGCKARRLMRTVADTDAGAAGVLCHQEVMRGVADHQGALGWDVEFFHQLVQHQRVGFACSLVSGA